MDQTVWKLLNSVFNAYNYQIVYLKIYLIIYNNNIGL